MSKVTWNGSTLLGPIPPVLVTCGPMERPNLLTIAWTGIINTIPPKTYISVRPERYSYELIRQSGEFVLNLPTAKLVRAVDFCGVRSGRDVDKWKEMNLTPIPGTKVACPVLAESPLSLECKVTEIIPMGSHDMFLADIVATDVEESLLDDKGALHLERAGLLAFAHGTYYALGDKLGTFGYSVRKKKKHRKPVKK